MNAQDLLVLDLGNVLDPYAAAMINRAKHDAAVTAMKMTGCRAMGVGPLDISAGYKFVETEHAPELPPMVAANLEVPAGLAPFIKKFLILEINGIKFGVTGAMPDHTARSLINPEFDVTDPQTALSQILPELKAKSDFIILLSQFDTKQTKALAQSLPMIDLALCTSRYQVDLDSPSDLRVMSVLHRGQQLGTVRVEKHPAKIVVKEVRRLLLNDDVPSDTDMQTLVKNTLKEIDLAKEAARQDALKKENKKNAFDTLKMTPEEFIKSYKRGTKQLN